MFSEPDSHRLYGFTALRLYVVIDYVVVVVVAGVVIVVVVVDVQGDQDFSNMNLPQYRIDVLCPLCDRLSLWVSCIPTPNPNDHEGEEICLVFSHYDFDRDCSLPSCHRWVALPFWVEHIEPIRIQLQ